jgi:hypothetical protein
MTFESGTSGNKQTEKRRLNSQAQKVFCLFPFACSPIGKEQGTSGVGAETPTTADSLPRYWEQVGNKSGTREQVNGKTASITPTCVRQNRPASCPSRQAVIGLGGSSELRKRPWTM